MNLSQKLAQFGKVNAPPGVNQFSGGSIGGIAIFLNILLRLLIIGAGLFTVFNLIFAGYGYISAGGDPKKVQDATSKITYSILGLTVAAGALVIAGVISAILFGDPKAILQIKIFGPQ